MKDLQTKARELTRHCEEYTTCMECGGSGMALYHDGELDSHYGPCFCGDGTMPSPCYYGQCEHIT